MKDFDGKELPVHIEGDTLHWGAEPSLSPDQAIHRALESAAPVAGKQALDRTIVVSDARGVDRTVEFISTIPDQPTEEL